MLEKISLYCNKIVMMGIIARFFFDEKFKSVTGNKLLDWKRFGTLIW